MKILKLTPLAALVLACAAHAAPATGDVILIGQTADYGGPQSAPVKETAAAARAYFDKVNKEGGVNGRKIVLEFDGRRLRHQAHRREGVRKARHQARRPRVDSARAGGGEETGIKESYGTMEGYLSARVMTEALKRAGKNPTREGLVTAFESLKLNLGGYQLAYSPTTRTGSEFVDLTMISRNGKFIR